MGVRLEWGLCPLSFSLLLFISIFQSLPYFRLSSSDWETLSTARSIIRNHDASYEYRTRSCTLLHIGAPGDASWTLPQSSTWTRAWSVFSNTWFLFENPLNIKKKKIKTTAKSKPNQTFKNLQENKRRIWGRAVNKTPKSQSSQINESFKGCQLSDELSLLLDKKAKQSSKI